MENTIIEETIQERNVTVGQLIEFLSKYPLDTPILLDKDGWPHKNSFCESERNMTPSQKISTLIDDHVDTFGYLIINN